MQPPVPPAVVDVAEYCRHIESYLCQKNGGHLMRVVGPAFEVVSSWARDGVPLKIAFSGIDRSVERYQRKGPKRRPVRIDFCDADVRDVFDEWRRAVGLTEAPRQQGEADVSGAQGSGQLGVLPARLKMSLPEHLERVLVRLSNARATGALVDRADHLIDRLSRDLDLARGSAAGLRGEARKATIARLADADAELAAIARDSLDEGALTAIAAQADEELAAFRSGMADADYERARGRTIARLILARLNLPTIAFS